MITSMALWASGREHDQPLLEAERVAHEASPTPVKPEQDDTPIVIPDGELLSNLKES